MHLRGCWSCPMHRKRLAAWLLAALAVLAVATPWALWRLGYLDAPPLFVRNFDGLIQDIPEAANGPWESGPVDKIPTLVGQTLEQVNELFGGPSQEYEFS